MRSLVIGHRGQDGLFLTTQLIAAGHEVLGVSRRDVEYLNETNGRSSKPGSIVHDRATSTEVILDSKLIEEIVETFSPDEIYYLAAFHHSAEAERPSTRQLLERSFDVHVWGLIHILEALLRYRPAAKLFYAASSHVFGNVTVATIDESTPLHPICAYGITKTAGVQTCRLYRKQHGLFASAGFLFNHESIYRKPEFLSKKIIRTAIAIREGHACELVLGDLSAVVDWGFAGDYTLAMQLVLQQEQSDDFVIASGERRTVQDFVDVVFGRLGLDARRYVHQKPNANLQRRPPLIGNATKLIACTGWSRHVSFEQMICDMVDYEVNATKTSTV